MTFRFKICQKNLLHVRIYGVQYTEVAKEAGVPSAEKQTDGPRKVSTFLNPGLHLDRMEPHLPKPAGQKHQKGREPSETNVTFFKLFHFILILVIQQECSRIARCPSGWPV